MPFKKGPVEFKVKEDGVNEVIDEKGNMALMLREVAWGGRDYHLELRKWIVDIDKEQPMKGCSFITEEGPHNLVDTMVKYGYGHTDTILKELSTRESFEEDLTKVIGKVKVQKAKESEVTITEDDYLDPKSLLG